MTNGTSAGRIHFGAMGVALGILVVVVSVVWVAILSLTDDGHPDEITWVG